MVVLQSSLVAGHASDMLLIVLILQLFTGPIYKLPNKAAYLLCMTKLLYEHGNGRERHSLICKAGLGFMRSAMTNNVEHVIHLIAQLQMPCSQMPVHVVQHNVHTAAVDTATARTADSISSIEQCACMHVGDMHFMRWVAQLCNN